MAAAVSVHVAIRADVHHEVVDVGAAAEFAEQFIAPGARFERDVDHLGPKRRAAAAGELVEFAERAVGDGVEQGRGDFCGRIVGF